MQEVGYIMCNYWCIWSDGKTVHFEIFDQKMYFKDASDQRRKCMWDARGRKRKYLFECQFHILDSSLKRFFCDSVQMAVYLYFSECICNLYLWWVWMAGRVHLAVSGRGKWFPQCASDGLVAALKLFAIHHCALLLCLQNVFIPHICHGRHGRRPCKFFLAGVNFYRFNAKNWQFTV